MSFFGSILGIPGVRKVVKHLVPLHGDQMDPKDHATELRIQAVLDSPAFVAAAKQGASASQLEAMLRQQMPQDFANWRLRASDSTPSGFRPTQAISKKRGAAYTAAGVGGGIGAAYALPAILGGGGAGAGGATAGGGIAGTTATGGASAGLLPASGFIGGVGSTVPTVAGSSLAGGTIAGAGTTAAGGGILGTAQRLAGPLTSISSGRQQGREAEANAQLSQDRNRIAAEQVNLKAPGIRGSQAVQGDILANAKDFSYGAPTMVGNIPVPSSSGGLRPSIFSDNTRALGSQLSADALRAQRTNNGRAIDLTPLPHAGIGDSILSNAATFASLLSAYRGGR